MNEDDVKQVLFDYAKVKKEMEFQEELVYRMGAFLIDLGNKLQDGPEKVLFEGQSYNAQQWGMLESFEIPFPDLVNVQELGHNTAKIRELRERYKVLSDQKENLQL